jgi:hypothetical protein
MKKIDYDSTVGYVLFHIKSLRMLGEAEEYIFPDTHSVHYER